MATSIQSSQFSVSQTQLSVGAALAAAPKATTGGDARGSAAAACSQRVRREGGEQGMRARATADDADSIAIGEASHGLWRLGIGVMVYRGRDLPCGACCVDLRSSLTVPVEIFVHISSIRFVVHTDESRKRKVQ